MPSQKGSFGCYAVDRHICLHYVHRYVSMVLLTWGADEKQGEKPASLLTWNINHMSRAAERKVLPKFCN